ncbi:Panacea domain-containing protein [Actinoplanes sp. G11-F43]|uniref:Panacea domain-containing protein n=1 Tax=Actinoplanes sp. G11-F43 TaxID=3424130 RepID=UPI003D352198
MHDVAAYVLSRRGPMSAMKLQKLLYYAQAWHLVWDDRPLFDEHIEAWANGPVIPALYAEHRGQFSIEVWPSGDPDGLSEGERESVDVVLEFYGDMTAHQLSELTHREGPWRDTREAAGVAPMERSSAVITPAAMQEYYLSVYDA